MEKSYSHFIGIPYDTMNCWDLSVKFYDEIMGIDLKSIHTDKTTPPRAEVKSLIYSNMGEFKEVTDPKFGDIIIIKMFGIESHIAVYLGNGTFLHTSKSCGSMIERVAKYKKIIVGFFRVKND